MTENGSMCNMNHREKEAIRYLGYGREAVDEATFLLIKDAFGELERIAEKRSVCRIFEFTQADSSHIRVGETEIESKNLGKNLQGCSEVIAFAVTLGIGIDRLLTRTSLRDMAKTLVLQACAAALLEEYCDQVQDALAAEMQTKGLYLRPRFSPGYGDFSITHQRWLLRLLDCEKKIGLTLTDSYMMVPSKSVTALIGVSAIETDCHRQGCELCGKKDCLYRRDRA